MFWGLAMLFPWEFLHFTKRAQGFQFLHILTNTCYLFFIVTILMGTVLITTFCTMSRTSIHSSSGTLSDLICWICFWTVVLEKTLESPLDCKEIQPVTSKGNQSWIYLGRTDAEADTPILWPPDARNCLTGKDPDAGKDWRQEEKGMTEGEMVGWHHRLDGPEFEQAPGVGDG